MKRLLALGVFVVVMAQGVFAQDTAAGEDEFTRFLVENGFYHDFMALKSEVSELKVLVSDLRTDIAGKQTELVYLKQELDALTAQKAQTQQEVEQAAGVLAGLQRQKQDVACEIEQGNKDLLALTEQKAQTQQEVEQAVGALAELNKQKQDIAREIEQGNKDLAALTEQQNARRAELDQTTRQKAQTQQEVEQATGALAELNKQKQDVARGIEQGNKDLAALTEQRNARRAELDQISGAIAAANQQKKAEPAKDAKPAQQSQTAAAKNAKPAQQSQTAAARDAKPAQQPQAAAKDAKPAAGIANLLDTVYFGPDSVELATAAMPVLDSIGERLRNNPQLKITVRGYSAPAGTSNGQMRVSESRAKTAASYLQANFGIDEGRIEIQWVGAQEIPKTASGSNFTELRAVEVFTI
jgi:outer membrane protein OmpA-like peptidoglycan-associated protein